MCEPTTIAMVGVTAAGAATSIYSQQKQAAFDAQVARNNATLAGYQRTDALAAGGEAASRIKVAGRQAASSAVAALAARGVDSTVGSGASVVAASQMNAAADAEMARVNALRQAWGFGQQQQDLLASARQRERSGVMGGVATGLGAVSSILRASG